MANTSPSYIAKGDINPCRFVKGDTSNDFGVLEADANEATVGISHDSTKAAPIPSASTLAAADGDNLRVFGPGDECLLELGGTVVRFDDLKSDADGKGVAAATTGATLQHHGAMALQSGISGNKIRVLVRQQKHYPALS